MCPWNKFAQAGRETKLAARQELRAPSLADLARLDDAAFRAMFTKSPVKRIGRDRFVRNVLIGIGNSNDRALAAEAERLLNDESPLVRGAAVWALSQLMGREAFEARAASALAGEADDGVRAEWQGRHKCSPLILRSGVFAARATQYSRDASDRIEKPRRTGSPGQAGRRQFCCGGRLT